MLQENVNHCFYCFTNFQEVGDQRQMSANPPTDIETVGRKLLRRDTNVTLPQWRHVWLQIQKIAHVEPWEFYFFARNRMGRIQYHIRVIWPLVDSSVSVLDVNVLARHI